VFDFLTGLSSWADPVLINDEVYYWAARQTVVAELPLLDMKADTVYRIYKSLDKLGLISYRKNGKQDCVKLTSLGKTYYLEKSSDQPNNPVDDTAPAMSDSNPNDYVGFKSEKEAELGFKSEKHSDSNPTDHTTIKTIRETRANNSVDKFSEFEVPTKSMVEELAKKESLNLTSYFEVRSRDGWKIINGTKSRPVEEWQKDARVWSSRQHGFSVVAKNNAASLAKATSAKYEPEETYTSPETIAKFREVVAGLHLRRIPI